MSSIIARIAVYYRQELPGILEATTKADGRMSITKDGIKKYDGIHHKAVRATIFVEEGGRESDDLKRISLIIKLLEELESNNQIVGYKNVPRR